MFDEIAPRYDFLNHFLTLGIDVLWRRRAVRMLRPYRPRLMVDIATGTADFAVEAGRLRPERIIGIDISPEMLGVGREKIRRKGLDKLIDLREGDSEALDLATDSVDAITVGFGVRNFEHLRLGLGEMLRVLRPGGAAVILEPSFPTRFPLRQLFYLHFRVLTPLLGRLISGNSAAYDYLPASVQAFPNGEDFLAICREVGYTRVSYHPLTFGICSLYLLEK
ncbi:MAG: bifunctional demethylmenaquinone methyltransferase/2-methoxy-6-polyprenyl-1,4-benzoquinol methylase UbiE [Bacteroidia bacterium]